MRRVVSVFFRRFATDRLRRTRNDAPLRDKPLVTSMPQGQKLVLAAVDRAAEKLGLEVGMSVTHARALVPELTVIDAALDADCAALNRIALWGTHYSPVVTADPPDGLFIDVAGSAHLFQGEPGVLADLAKRLGAAKLSVKTAIADTPGCAWAMARFGGGGIIAPGRASEALASLPVAALRLSAKTVDALHDVGIERIAQIASKPRASLSLRFGGELLLRYDQAMGTQAEALPSLIPPEVPRTELRFVEPISTPENLKTVIDRLCGMLCPELERRGIGTRRLDLIFLRVDNIAQAIRIGLSRPYREPKHLAKLLGERIATSVDPGFGIESASLTASWVEALTERQTVGHHMGDGESAVDVSQLVDTLGLRLGSAKVFRAEAMESELPERAVRRVPVLAATPPNDWPAQLPRPPRLFVHPEKVTAIAELPDYPPRLFVWRNVRHRVLRADGPERIRGEWWISESEKHLVRDYYRVETADGARYWLFRDGPVGEGGSWWLHGVGDA